MTTEQRIELHSVIAAALKQARGCRHERTAAVYVEVAMTKAGYVIEKRASQ